MVVTGLSSGGVVIYYVLLVMEEMFSCNGPYGGIML